MSTENLKQRRAKYDAEHGPGALDARLAELRRQREKHRNADTESYIKTNRGIYRFDPSDEEAARVIAERGTERKRAHVK